MDFDPPEKTGTIVLQCGFSSVQYDFPLESVSIEVDGRIVPIDVLASSASGDPTAPAPDRCKTCNTKLLTEVSKASGYCVGCTAAKKQIGPDRPKG